jgi:ATP-binding cassette subfamily B multidrug efflux pump
MKKNTSTLKKIFGYIGHYKYLLLLSVLLAGGSVVLTLYVPIRIGYAIDAIIGPGQVDFTVVARHLITVVVMLLCVGLMQWVMNILNNKITYNVVRDMRARAFDKLLVLPFSYLDSHSQGDVVSRVISDADQFADGLLMGFSQLFTGVVTIIGTLAFMLSINVWITLVVVVVTPLSFFIARFIAKKTYAMFQKQSAVRGEQTGFIDEMITNQKVVTAYSKEADNQKQFDEINDRLAKYSMRATFFSSITNPATRFVNSIVYAAVALFGAMIAIRGNISVGMLSCFLSYANQYTKPFNDISSVVTEFQNALACAARIMEFIEEEPVPADPEGALQPSRLDGKVELQHVRFSYLPDRKLIEDLSVDVQPGMRVAIVGPTGCGKTTLINLLMRFYDVQDGQITIDGTPVQKIGRKALRKNFGMVLQDTWLKCGSILENIRMGNPGASYDEVVAAAKKAHAHSFIQRLPEGYYTKIGEDGGSLSQGQKQLLCIARIMLCNPSVLILDEATSSIDTTTEMRIQKAFLTLMEGRTSFIVAHRLSTIKGADLILVMKDGTIIEQGTHASLLADKGFYYHLYNSQFPETDQLA